MIQARGLHCRDSTARGRACGDGGRVAGEQGAQTRARGPGGGQPVSAEQGGRLDTVQVAGVQAAEAGGGQDHRDLWGDRVTERQGPGRGNCDGGWSERGKKALLAKSGTLLLSSAKSGT